MKMAFDDVMEYNTLWQSVHDSIIYWIKKRQEAQGKINMSVDGTGAPYDEQYCIDMMVTNALLLQKIEDLPHPEWDGTEYVLSEAPEIHSSIITKTLKLIPKASVE